MVKATSINRRTLRFDGQAEIEPGAIPYFQYTVPEDSKSHRVGRLSNGAELWIGSIRLRVRTNPVLSTSAAGHFRPVTLCPGNGAVLVGGSVISSSAMPEHVE
jgi:hypothetical protein